jgi:hypothetical protein
MASFLAPVVVYGLRRRERCHTRYRVRDRVSPHPGLLSEDATGSYDVPYSIRATHRLGTGRGVDRPASSLELSYDS